eukprot:m.318139 g.318139  ORF g.318139 m.318139 type:complete len:128 (+) comp27569_c0_seq1:2015-2398(+)
MQAIAAATVRVGARAARLAPRAARMVSVLPTKAQSPWFVPVKFYGSAAPPTVAEVEAKILSILRTNSKIDDSKLQINADFIEDLGLDSLDLVECVMFVEDEFAIELSDDQALEIKCPKDLLAYIDTA